jgi:AraC-like DNA-binding protein
MAHFYNNEFYNNEQQIFVEPVYRRDGLKIERIQRFDQPALLPEIARWRAWSFRITMAGTHYVRYEDHTYTLAPNTIFWNSPLKASVRTHCLPGTGSDVVVLTCSTRRWNEFLEQQAAFRVRNAVLLDRWPHQPLLAPQIAPPQVLHLLQQFVALSHAPNVSTLALENYCRLLLRLIGELRFDIAIQRQSDERRLRVEQAQGRMVAHLARPLSLRQIAADLNVSLRQLQRDFLACTGLTPMRYLNFVRLSEANTLLAETTLPIAEIARLLGYVRLTHFSASFRQVYHVSPRQVRASHQPRPTTHDQR